MHRLIFALALLILTGCSTTTVYIEPDAELIPKDQALAFLRSEEIASPWVMQFPCVFTKAGLHAPKGFTPYEDLYFYTRSAIGGYQVLVVEKGSLYGCVPYSGEENQELFNKISTALTSLGIDQKGGTK